MNYREIYDGLSQPELRNVATRARLSVADVRQEALLWCWQIASGRSDYDVRRGTVRRYVMAKLWGLAARESELPMAGWMGTDEGDDEAVCRLRAIEARQATLSILDDIIDREEREEIERRMDKTQREDRCRYAGLSTVGVLMDQGISSVRIALLIGVTPQAVRQRVARERAQIRCPVDRLGSP